MSSYNQNKNDITKVDIKILSCTGNLTPIEGTCKIRMYIQKHPTVYRDITAMVVDDLTEDAIIGYDILSSHLTQALTKNAWILKNNKRFPDIIVPIQKEYMDVIPCQYLKIAHTQPLTPIVEHCQEQQDGPRRVYPKIKHYEVIKLVKKFRKRPEFNFNTDPKPITERDRQMLMDFLAKEYPLLAKQARDLADPIAVQTARLTATPPPTIKSDLAMNDGEQKYETEQYRQKGYYQPSITQFIEDKSSVTELSLVDTTPKSDEQFLEMFDIDH
ncbi:MAG: hypothetical protein ACRC0J_12710, partial [Shewanella oncorhynchi]